tara:strand:- start:43 stop:753 length:711 start_codon:yes stop_codon:yes gene_type:complete
MGVISALKTLSKTGDNLIVPQEIKTEIARIENLGGKLDELNANNLSDKGLTLTPSQIETLYKREKDNGNLGEFDESTYEAWIKYKEENPRVGARKAKELTQSILTRVLTRVAKQNRKDNLDYYNENPDKIKATERKSFIEEYELRPSFPVGFDNVVRQEPIPDLGNLLERTEGRRVTAPSNKTTSTEGNITTVDFTALKPKSLDFTSLSKKDTPSRASVDFGSFKPKDVLDIKNKE